MKAPREPKTDADFATLQYPLFASFKEDGLRCLLHPELGPVSRTFKPIRNKHIVAELKSWGLTHLDGEIVIRDRHNHDLSFNDTQSAVMSVEGESNFQYRVFDSFLRPDYPFTSRWVDAKRAIIVRNDFAAITWIEQLLVQSPEELQDLWHRAADLNKEGLVLRSLQGHYKSGRTTEREGIMWKCMTLVREEAVIHGWEPMYQNCNVAKADEFGRTKRSKHAANMIEQPLLGTWLVKNHWGYFNVSGFTALERETFWRDRESYVGKTIVYKYKPHGSKDLPRHPIFVGFRDAEDL